MTSQSPGPRYDLESDPVLARIDEGFDHILYRFDRFERLLLETIDRRLRWKTKVEISTIVTVGAVIVAAIRL